MDEEKILESITTSISDKLKRPIIVTYVCVLILYNWDIIFYLLFEDNSATVKIDYIKNTYHLVYIERVLACILIAIVIIVLFTVLNTFLNFVLKWFYRKDKEISSEIDSYEKISSLTEQLSSSIDEIKALQSQINSLENINKSISLKKLDLKISDISEMDYQRLLDNINREKNNEKLLYSLKELISALKHNNSITLREIYEKSTYQNEMKILIRVLENMNLIGTNSLFDRIKVETSFKDILKMDI